MRLLLLSILLFAGGLLAQTSTPAASSATNPLQAPAAAASAPATLLQQISDPVTISGGAYVLSQVASSATAWKATVGGKVYTVSAAQKAGWTGLGIVASATLAHKYPKLKLPLTVALAGASAYYGGVAYANSLGHGTATTASPPAAATPAFRSQFRFGR